MNYTDFNGLLELSKNKGKTKKYNVMEEPELFFLAFICFLFVCPFINFMFSFSYPWLSFFLSISISLMFVLFLNALNIKRNEFHVKSDKQLKKKYLKDIKKSDENYITLNNFLKILINNNVVSNEKENFSFKLSKKDFKRLLKKQIKHEKNLITK